jgi:uncharacterized protein (UPF0332 family)
MKVNLSDLLRDDRVRRGEPDPQQAKECLKGAERDIRVAKGLLEDDLDWAFAVAYNSALQSARALMFAEGYYLTGEGHHKVAVDYALVKFGQRFRDMMDLFDIMRKKRHEAVYFSVGCISEFEAKKAIEFASFLREKVKEKISRF